MGYVSKKKGLFGVRVVKQTTPKVDCGGLAGIERNEEYIDIRDLKIE
ncbi:TPA_asm: hypothetical protein [Altiarchaeum virus]|nr:TPA_asm: hypothetical protein [Altiarchaeum virus]